MICVETGNEGGDIPVRIPTVHDYIYLESLLQHFSLGGVF